MTTTTPMTDAVDVAELARLHRVRNGVRAALMLGVAASVAGNILHAEPTLVGRSISAWSPLALLLTVELISRVPVSDPLMAFLRRFAAGLIAGIAAWVSYWHMVSVAARNGESVTSAHLLPLSVDGLVMVASVSLVEIGARLAHLAAAHATEAVITADTIPDSKPDTEPDSEPAETPDSEPATKRPTTRTRRPVSVAVTVARLRAKHPDWTVGQIAAKTGVTERTVRRHLSAAVAAPDSPELADVEGEPDAEARDRAA